jgi:hypothetical protein
MLCPDEIFQAVRHHLPPPSRRHAEIAFRRIVREHTVYRAATSRAPAMKSGKKIVVGCRLVYTGRRWRRVYRFLTPTWLPRGKGRPRNLAEELLVSRLAHLWAKSHKKRTTISFKGYTQVPTDYENFMMDVLVRLGVHNHRKYLERHSSQK